ncbi:MAG: hypothetical protein ACK2UH_06970, partial [Candidatus Promineifilaceae bacterium]
AAADSLIPFRLRDQHDRLLTDGRFRIAALLVLWGDRRGADFMDAWAPLLADSLGEDEEAAGILDEALALVDETGERFFEAELWRLYGEYLWHGGGEPTEAEECFQRALAIAGRQRTRSLALRAATSLARLWSQQERGDEAAELLGETISSFNEGFDTPDVEDAQLLLESLHRSTVTALSVATQHE